MVLTTWRGTCFSGVGIGMGHLMQEVLIHEVYRQARSVCVGAAVRATTRTSAGRRSAAPTTRPTGTTTSGSVPSCPQVSELNGRSGGQRTAPRSGRDMLQERDSGWCAGQAMELAAEQRNQSNEMTIEARSQAAEISGQHPPPSTQGSSARIAMFIATPTQDAAPSSVGAAWMGDVALGRSCGAVGYKHAAPMGLGGSGGAPGYKHAAPTGLDEPGDAFGYKHAAPMGLDPLSSPKSLLNKSQYRCQRLL